MGSFVSKRTFVAVVIVTVMLIAVFFTGIHHGYYLGYEDGEKKANGWWIDKKSLYYESSEIIKKRFTNNHNCI